MSFIARCAVYQRGGGAGVLRLHASRRGIRFNSSSSAIPSIFPKESPVRSLGTGKFKVRFTQEHEWIAVHEQDRTGYLGITKHAADALGDIVFIELPQQGAEIERNDSIGAVESVKSASEVYSPISGKILEINKSLIDSPKTINHDPYGQGWITKVQLSSPDQLDALLDEAQYNALIEESDD